MVAPPDITVTTANLLFITSYFVLCNAPLSFILSYLLRISRHRHQSSFAFPENPSKAWKILPFTEYTYFPFGQWIRNWWICTACTRLSLCFAVKEPQETRPFSRQPIYKRPNPQDVHDQNTHEVHAFPNPPQSFLLFNQNDNREGVSRLLEENNAESNAGDDEFAGMGY